MLKTNRFVKITSVPGLPFTPLLKGLRVPIVASQPDTVDRFQGYVLAIHLATSLTIQDPNDPRGTLEPCTLMLLHRDVDRLCLALTNGDAHSSGFSVNLRISITVAPLLAYPLDKQAASVKTFFSNTTQKALLAPLRTRLRGIKNVNIQGHIDQSVAREVLEDMAQDRCVDSAQVLADFSAAKDKGSRLFQDHQHEEASLVWQDAARNIQGMHASTSWEALVGHGGESFIFQLAELYFIVLLNMAQAQITVSQRAGSDPHMCGYLGDVALNCAKRSLNPGHWMTGYKYQPAAKLLAKMTYRLALVIRLRADVGIADRALHHIDRAVELLPGDAAILQERNNILAWMARGN